MMLPCHAAQRYEFIRREEVVLAYALRCQRLRLRHAASHGAVIYYLMIASIDY